MQPLISARYFLARKFFRCCCQYCILYVFTVLSGFLIFQKTRPLSCHSKSAPPPTLFSHLFFSNLLFVSARVSCTQPGRTRCPLASEWHMLCAKKPSMHNFPTPVPVFSEFPGQIYCKHILIRDRKLVYLLSHSGILAVARMQIKLYARERSIERKLC